MMAQQHYAVVAAALREALESTREPVRVRNTTAVIMVMAVHLAKDNPRFNRNLFFAACGLQPNGQPEFRAADPAPHPGKGGYHGVT